MMPNQPTRESREENQRPHEKSICRHCGKIIWRITDEQGLKYGWKHWDSWPPTDCVYPKTHAEPTTESGSEGKQISSLQEAAMRNKPRWYQTASRVLAMFKGGYNPTERQLDQLQSCLDEFDSQPTKDAAGEDGWVDVREELPERPPNHIEASEDVIAAVIVDGEIERWDRACLCAFGDDWAKDGIVLNWTPTHWRPLPAPPAPKGERSSTDQLAANVGREMIDNLRHNVGMKAATKEGSHE